MSVYVVSAQSFYFASFRDQIIAVWDNMFQIGLFFVFVVSVLVSVSSFSVFLNAIFFYLASFFYWFTF